MQCVVDIRVHALHHLSVDQSEYVYIYIYIYLSQSTRDTSIAQLLTRRQLQALLRWNTERICTNKHFNALGCIQSLLASRIARLGATWFLPLSHFWLTPFNPRGRDPFHCSLKGGERRIQVLLAWFALRQVQISGWQLKSRYMLMIKTKDLYSAYCPTEGCTYHAQFYLNLSPARLLPSYVCPKVCRLNIHGWLQVHKTYESLVLK